MAETPPATPPPTPPAGASSSQRPSKILLGCGLGCLTLAVLCIIATLIGVWWVRKTVDKYAQEFEERGFRKQAGQVLEITETMEDKTLLLGQVVKLRADANDDLAIVAQSATIDATINANLYFRGQMLEITPQGRIVGDLDVQAQVINNKGAIDGEIRGNYQTMGAYP